MTYSKWNQNGKIGHFYTLLSEHFTSGSLCKNCEWEIKIRSTQNKTRRINSGIAEGKNKSYPVVDDDDVCNNIQSKFNSYWTMFTFKNATSYAKI